MSSEQELAVSIATTLKERLTKYIALTGEMSPRPPRFQKDTDPEYLVWMCEQIITNAAEWPATKSHRWVGYVQGCLVSHGLSNVKTEADLVREAKKTFPET